MLENQSSDCKSAEFDERHEYYISMQTRRYFRSPAV